MKIWPSSSGASLFRFGFLCAILCIVLFAATFREEIKYNIDCLRLGKTDINLDFREIVGGISEQNIVYQYPSLRITCSNITDTPSLGTRACSADIRSLWGIRAYQIVFFLKNNRLAHMKVDIPWWNHGRIKDQLLEQYGDPYAKQFLPRSGVRLMGWKLDNGALLFDRDRGMNIVLWHSIQWISNEEARRKGGVFH